MLLRLMLFDSNDRTLRWNDDLLLYIKIAMGADRKLEREDHGRRRPQQRIPNCQSRSLFFLQSVVVVVAVAADDAIIAIVHSASRLDQIKN